MAGLESILTSRIWSNKLDRVVACILCKESGQSPMVQLNCFHVYHKSCIEELHGNPTPGSELPCRECKTPFTIPADGLDGLPEELLQHKQEQINKINSNDPPPCTICHQVTTISSNYCLVCKKYMCQAHKIQHDIFLEGHEVITLEETKKGEYLPRIISSEKSPCLIHVTDNNSAMMDSYCHQCQTLVCQFCIEAAHKRHEIISLQEASHKPKRALKSKADLLSKEDKKCQFVIDYLGFMLHEIEAKGQGQIRECEQWGESIIEVVNKIVKERVQLVHDMTQIQKDTVTRNIEEINNQKKQFLSAKDYMDVFLEFGSSLDVLSTHEVFLKNLNACLQKNTSVELTLDKITVVSKHVREIKPTLLKMLTVLEHGSEFHQIPPPPPTPPRPIPQQPPPPPPPQQLPPQKRLKSCELESKERTDEMRTGVAVDGDEIIAVNGKKIDIYGMNAQKKEQVKCLELLSAADIEIHNNQLFISDCNSSKRQILIMDRRGNVQRKISLPNEELTLDGAHILSLGIDHILGDLYIASLKTNSIYKCPNRQDEAVPFITEGLDGPMSLCVTPKHELIVSNHHSHTVKKYKNGGNFMWRYGRKGTGKGELKRPTGVCVDPWGYIFVCDYDNDRIHYVSPEGEFVSFIEIGKKIEFPHAITLYKTEKLIVTRNTRTAGQGKLSVFKCRYY